MNNTLNQAQRAQRAQSARDTISRTSDKALGAWRDYLSGLSHQRHEDRITIRQVEIAIIDRKQAGTWTR